MGGRERDGGAGVEPYMHTLRVFEVCHPQLPLHRKENKKERGGGGGGGRTRVGGGVGSGLLTLRDSPPPPRSVKEKI